MEVQVDTLSDGIYKVHVNSVLHTAKHDACVKIVHAFCLTLIVNGFNSIYIVVQEYKERLQTSEKEEQHLLKASELKQKMVRARDAQISNLKTSNKVLQEKCEQSQHISFSYCPLVLLLILHKNALRIFK